MTQDQAAVPDRINRTAITGMVLVAVAFGAFVRLFRLNWQSLWVDEIHTLGPALHATSVADAFWNYINLAPTPPFYYLFMMGWTNAFGFSETTLRLPSALAGIATIGVFWWGLTRVFDRQTSAVATIFMALSWPALFYSQEVRGYAAVLLFTTLAAVLAVKILKNFDGAPLGAWLFLLGASVFAAMTHPFGFVINGFLLLYLFAVALARRRWRLRSFLVGAFLLAAYVPWLVVNLMGAKWVLESPVFSRLGAGFFVEIGAFLFHHPAPAVLIAIIPLAIGGLAYIGQFRAALLRGALENPVVFLPFMLAAPFAFVFLIAQFQPFLYTRYLIVFLPYIYMFFAVVLMSRTWRNEIFPVGLVFVLGLTAQFWIFRDYYEIAKPQTRELAQYVLSQSNDTTAIVTGCDPAPPFECALGSGKATDADWSKYLFYLNRDQLPAFTVVPDVFYTMADLDLLVNRYRANGVGRVILMGSRGGLAYVATATGHMQNNGFECRPRQFHLASAAICTTP